MLQTFTFTGVGRQIDAKARFFRYESGSAGGADESIKVRADGNDLGSYLPGDALRLPVDASRWEIVPVNAAATGTVRVGIGSVESARLVGTVNVVDQSVSKTRLGTQFWGTSTVNALAANFATASLQVTGGLIALKLVTVTSATAQQVTIGRSTGAGTANALGGSGPANKYFGHAAPIVGRTNGGYCAAQLPTGAEIPGFMVIARFDLAPGVPLPCPLSTPFFIEGSNGLAFVAQTANTNLVVALDLEVVS